MTAEIASTRYAAPSSCQLNAKAQPTSRYSEASRLKFLCIVNANVSGIKASRGIFLASVTQHNMEYIHIRVKLISLDEFVYYKNIIHFQRKVSIHLPTNIVFTSLLYTFI